MAQLSRIVPAGGTIPGALAATIAADPTQPLITFYDDATGERAELSGATMLNWVAKTANLLRDGLGLGESEVAQIRLPAHWQTAAVLLGCWSAGLAVDLDGVREAPAEVAFVTAQSVTQVSAPETYALALAPMAASFRPGPPPGALDFIVEVRAYGDTFTPAGISAATAAFADGTSHGDALDAAASWALGDREGSTDRRVMVDADARPDPRHWLLAPLALGASLVLCRNLDPTRLAARLTTERAHLLAAG